MGPVCLNLTRAITNFPQYFSHQPFRTIQALFKKREVYESHSFFKPVKYLQSGTSLKNLNLISKIVFSILGFFKGQTLEQQVNIWSKETAHNLFNKGVFSYQNIEVSNEVFQFIVDKGFKIQNHGRPITNLKEFLELDSSFNYWKLLITELRIKELSRNSILEKPKITALNFLAYNLESLQMWLKSPRCKKEILDKILESLVLEKQTLFFDEDKKAIQNLTRLVLENYPLEDSLAIIDHIVKIYSANDLQGEDLNLIGLIFSKIDFENYQYHLINKRQTFINALAFAGKNEALNSLKNEECFDMLDKEGASILHFSAAGGNFTLFDQLVEKEHWDQFEVDDQGRNCLIYAMNFGTVETCKELIKRGFKLDYVDKHGNNLAYFAAGRSDLSFAEWVYDQNPKLFNQLNIQKQSILFNAAAKGNYYFYKWFLEKNIPLENKLDVFNQFYIHSALKHGQLAFLKCFQLASMKGLTDHYVKHAAAYSQKAVIEYLMYDGYIIPKDTLKIAASGDDPEFLQWLLVEKKVPLKDHSILMSISNNEPAIAVAQLKILLKAGLNPDLCPTNIFTHLYSQKKQELAQAIVPYLFGTEVVLDYLSDDDTNFQHIFDVFCHLFIVDREEGYQSFFKSFTLEQAIEMIQEVFEDEEIQNRLIGKLEVEHALLDTEIGLLEIVEEVATIPEPTYTMMDFEKLINQFAKKVTTTDKKSNTYISKKTLLNLGLNDSETIDLWATILLSRLKNHELYKGVPNDEQERNEWYLNLKKLLFNICEAVEKLPTRDQTPYLAEIICTATRCGGTMGDIHQLYQLLCLKKIDFTDGSYLEKTLKQLALMTRYEYLEKFLNTHELNDVHDYNFLLNQVADQIGLIKSYENDQYGGIPTFIIEVCLKNFKMQYPRMLLNNILNKSAENETFRLGLEETAFETLTEDAKSVFKQQFQELSPDDLELINQMLAQFNLNELELYQAYFEHLQELKNWYEQIPKYQKSLKTLQMISNLNHLVVNDELLKELENLNYPKVDLLKSFTPHLLTIKHVKEQITNLRNFLPINNLTQKLIEFSSLSLEDRRKKLIENYYTPELKHHFLGSFYKKTNVINIKYLIDILLNFKLLYKKTA